MRGIIGSSFGLCLAIFSVPALAATQHEAVPTGWRLENYPSDGVAIWYTGAPNCNDGRVNFPAGWIKDDKNRFWSLVLSAKMSGKAIGFFYDGSGWSCVFVSFYVQ